MLTLLQPEYPDIRISFDYRGINDNIYRLCLGAEASCALKEYKIYWIVHF